MCDRPAQGYVPEAGQVPAHTCWQCALHCQMAAYIRDLTAPER